MQHVEAIRKLGEGPPYILQRVSSEDPLREEFVLV